MASFTFQSIEHRWVGSRTDLDILKKRKSSTGIRTQIVQTITWSLYRLRHPGFRGLLGPSRCDRETVPKRRSPAVNTHSLTSQKSQDNGTRKWRTVSCEMRRFCSSVGCLPVALRRIVQHFSWFCFRIIVYRQWAVMWRLSDILWISVCSADCRSNSASWSGHR